jgi:hypothetical protein
MQPIAGSSEVLARVVRGGPLQTIPGADPSQGAATRSEALSKAGGVGTENRPANSGHPSHHPPTSRGLPVSLSQPRVHLRGCHRGLRRGYSGRRAWSRASGARASSRRGSSAPGRWSERARTQAVQNAQSSRLQSRRVGATPSSSSRTCLHRLGLTPGSWTRQAGAPPCGSGSVSTALASIRRSTPRSCKDAIRSAAINRLPACALMMIPWKMSSAGAATTCSTVPTDSPSDA